MLWQYVGEPLRLVFKGFAKRKKKVCLNVLFGQYILFLVYFSFQCIIAKFLNCLNNYLLVTFYMLTVLLQLRPNIITFHWYLIFPHMKC